MGYPKYTDAMVRTADEMQHTKGLGFAKLLQNLSFNETAIITAGASDTTTAKALLVAPTKLRVTKAVGVIDVVQTGTGNTPVVQLYNKTKDEVIAASAAIALGGAIGDKIAMTLTSANTDVAEGDVLQVRVVNPAGTITVALQARVQVEWNSEA